MERLVETPPSLLGLYARAALAATPLGRASGSPRGDGAVPDLSLVLPRRRTDPEHLRRYQEVCSLDDDGVLPATYTHVLAFGLHVLLMSDPTFPYPALGMVHVANRIEQLAPISARDVLDLRVHAEGPWPHPRGAVVTIAAEAAVDGDVRWRGRSAYLKRGTPVEGEQQAHVDVPAAAPFGPQVWTLPGDLGRRYAAASGDRNPIHLSALTARPLGFRRAIAHGMWTQARCLAEVQNRLGPSYVVDVEFRRPVFLPGRARFGARDDGRRIDFGLTSVGVDHTHVLGRLTRQ